MARTLQTARKSVGKPKPARPARRVIARTSKKTVARFVKKPRRKRPEPSALHRFLRETAKPRDVTIPQKSFEKLVKGLVAEWAPGIKFQAPVIGALQEAAEAMLVGRFEDANLCAIHAKRITVQARDMQVARLLRDRKELWEKEPVTT